MVEKLEKYIEKRLEEGFSEGEIREKLQKTRYGEEAIDKALSEIRDRGGDEKDKTGGKSQRLLYLFFAALVVVGLFGIFYVDGISFGVLEEDLDNASLRFETEESEDPRGFNLTIFLVNPTRREPEVEEFGFTTYRNQTQLSEVYFGKDEMKEHPAFFETVVPPDEERKIYRGRFLSPQDPENQVPGKREINYRVRTDEGTIEEDFKYEVQYPDNTASYTFL